MRSSTVDPPAGQPASTSGLPLQGAPLIALSSALLAGAAVLARTLMSAVATGQLVVLRFGVGLIALAALFLVRRRAPTVRRPWLWVLRGVLGGGAVYGYFWSISEVGVGVATLLNFTFPVYTALFGALFLKERVTVRLAAALGVAIFGAGLVAWSSSGPGQPTVFSAGAWAGVASAVFYGASSTTVRSLRSDTDAPTVLLSFCLFGALLGLPMAVAQWRPLTAELLWPCLGMAALFFVAQLGYTHAFAFVTAAAGSATMLVTPALAWGMGVVFLDEQARPLTVAGAALCLVGVAWASLGAERIRQA